MKYNIIYCDPPWQFKNKNTSGSMKSGADAKYSTMDIEQLAKLPINELSTDDCVLFMWWIASMPKSALRLVNEWGFTLKTMTGFTWVKTTKNGKLGFGMGFWTRQLTENCLIATKGKPVRKDAAIRNVIVAENTEHSKKPAIVRTEIVKLCGDIARLEMFAREQSTGWECVGNEINGIDIRKSLKLLTFR